MKKEKMTKEELHKYGIQLMISYLNKREYTIMETNYLLDTNPQIVAQKGNELAFILVSTFMYPQKTVSFDKVTIDVLKKSAENYGAKCYVAKIGLANAEAKNTKELAVPYKDIDFIVKFKGLERL